MTLSDLIHIANEHYDDGWLAAHFDFNTNKAEEDSAGDTLALFVVRELVDTYDADASDEDQLREAIRVMESAARQLQVVASGLAAAYPRSVDSEPDL